MDGRTALHWVAMQNQVETLRTLLGEADDASIEDDHGITPLEYAQMFGHQEIVELLEAKQNTGP
jgi:ankyrin repeat protein